MSTGNVSNNNHYDYLPYLNKMENCSKIVIIAGGIIALLGVSLFFYPGVGSLTATGVTATGATLLFSSMVFLKNLLNEKADYEAFQSGKWEDIEYNDVPKMMAKYPNVMFKNGILHLALSNPGSPVEQLIEQATQSDLNAQDENGDTPLHIAIRMWQPAASEGIKTIMQDRIVALITFDNINMTNKDDRTPLQEAMRKGDDLLLSILKVFYI